MIRKYLCFIAAMLVCCGLEIKAQECSQDTDKKQPVDYVNPFIGTTNYGATNPGAVSPNGLMSVVPFNVMGSDDNRYDKDANWWSTPYDYRNKFFTGFAHVSLSGVGCPDMSSLLTIATTGELEVDYKNYGSGYANEVAKPGYYGITLTKYGIKAEATVTPRTSIERYTFPKGDGNILMNLGEGLTNESGAMVRRVSDTEIEGVKLLGTFCYNPQAVFPIYFVMRVSKKPSNTGYWKKQPPKFGVEAQWDKDAGYYKIYTQYGKEIAGDDIGYFFSYKDLKEGEVIEVKIGVSMVSVENARLNLNSEQADGATFQSICSNVREQWNRDLGKIEVNGTAPDKKEIFYTALYHALIHPNIVSDVNGEYPKMGTSQTGKSDYTRYTVFSLWDTYRNVHQLLTLLYPERQQDMVRSMVDMYKESGWLPKWELYAKETYTMDGDPAIPVIVDTWMKGLRDFDVETAYQAMRKSATTPGKDNPIRPNCDEYIKRGYIPLGVYQADLSGDNSVSDALEYYVADHALGMLADSLGYKDDAQLFKARSLGYRNYYCKTFGVFRPINLDGTFYKDFNPRAGENFENVPGFHEGSAWNYTFYAPHDINGLIKLMGGKKAFTEKLQMVFDKGYFDPTNEPDIAYPYLFSRIKGEEWRTQKTVAQILNKYYTTKTNGIPGNDDTGTLSAWAVFSMMGFYPDCPAEPFYTVTVPSFDSIVIHLKDQDLKIEKRGNGDYIKSVRLGGKAAGYRILHRDLLKHKTLTIDTFNR